MHDSLLSPEEVCSWSYDAFKFWEVIENISETVQDGDIDIMED